jgi:hypothetical protein
MPLSIVLSGRKPGLLNAAHLPTAAWPPWVIRDLGEPTSGQANCAALRKRKFPSHYRLRGTWTPDRISNPSDKLKHALGHSFRCRVNAVFVKQPTLRILKSRKTRIVDGHRRITSSTVRSAPDTASFFMQRP